MNIKPFIIVILVAFLSYLSFGQESEKITADENWIYLKGGQNALGVEFRKDNTVFFNGKLLMSCNYMEGAGDVYISKPSPKKGLSLVKCVYDDVAYIIDTKQNVVFSKDIIPKDDSLGQFVAWSPDEKYLISVKGGEGICIIFFILDLENLRARELRIKDCGSKLETNDFEDKNFSWIDNKTFQVRINILCNPYDADNCDRDKVIRSYNARVNVVTATAAYGTPQTKISRTSLQKNTIVKKTLTKKPATAAVTSIRQVDFRNFTYLIEDGKTIKVTKGKWEDRKPEFYGGVYSFEISQIMYGDLTRDGQEEAFINVDGASNYGASGWNSTYNKYYIYTMSNGDSKLLYTFDSSAVDEIYEPYKNPNNECDASVVGFRVKTIINSVMTLDLGVRGSICDGPSVVMKVRFDGNRLVLIGKPIKSKGNIK